MNNFLFRLVIGSLLVVPFAAYSQNMTASGQFTPGHTVRCANQVCTVVTDAGGSGGSSTLGSGYLTEIGITNTGTPFCINDALTSGPYHSLCLGANSLGGGLISYAAYGGASPLNLNFSINGALYQFPGPGNGNVVATDAALAASATTFYPNGVWRADYSAGVGAPPLFFKPESGTCAANGRINDGGSCRNTIVGDGNSYYAVFPDVIDAREFGPAMNGVTDDTLIWHAIDQAEATLPSPLPVTFIGTTAIDLHSVPNGNLCWRNIPRIYGTIGETVFTSAAATGANDYPICYQGAGPFEMDHFTYSGPLPIWSTSSSASNAGDVAIYLSGQFNSPETTPVEIKLHDFTTVGGSSIIQIGPAARVDIGNFLIKQAGGFGIVPSDFSDTLVAQTSYITVHDGMCVVTGGDCISGPADQNTGTPSAPRHIVYRNVKAVASAIFDGFSCFEFTGSSGDYLEATGLSGTDCPAGGFETKLAFSPQTPVPIPPFLRGTFIQDFSYLGHIDQGVGIDIISENPTQTVPAAHQLARVGASVAYAPAALWQANRQYHLGDAADIGPGHVEIAVVEGTSAGSQPSGGGKGTIDGGVVWYTLLADPSSEGAVAAQPAAGISGSGYVATDRLTITSACGESPIFNPIVQGGAVVGLKMLYEGQCAPGSIPSNPVTIAGGTGTGATAYVQWSYISAGLGAGEIGGLSDATFDVTAHRTATGITLRPQGELNQTIERVLMRLRGTVETACLTDLLTNEQWTVGSTATAHIVQNGYVYDSAIDGECHSMGQANGAILPGFTQAAPAWAANSIYFQNALVTNSGNTYIAQCSVAGVPVVAGCQSGNSGGPAGTGTGIADGANGLTWNFYASGSTSAAITYKNLRFLGGYYLNPTFSALYENGTLGSFDGEFVGTRLIGGNGGMYLQEPTTLRMSGAPSLAINYTGGGVGSPPIDFDQTTGTGTVTIDGMMEVTTNGTTNKQAWADTNSATGTVAGMLIRGSETSAPGAIPCNWGESWLNSQPSAAAPFGWTCTTPSASAGTFTAH